MSRLGCLLLFLVASTQVVEASSHSDRHATAARAGQDAETATPTPVIPTVTVFQATPVSVPTVTIPRLTPVPARTARRTHRPRHAAHPRVHAVARPQRTWIWAYLTSYCPGSAGWISSNGTPVFYGMLANDYYAFGTRVYLPVLGITGVVEDRLADLSWNHFDVWSVNCFSTPTGWFRVAIQR